MKKASQFGVLLLALALSYSCGGDTGSCNLGELDCACNAGQCLGDLACENDICVASMDDGSESMPESDDSSDQETDSDSMTSVDTGTDSSDTGTSCEPPEVLCNGNCVDVMNDNSNCGECGNECQIALDVGECVEGACTPTYSDCFNDPGDPKPSCTEVCEMQGFVGCGACGQQALTVLWYATTLDCENDNTVITEGDMCEGQPTSSPFSDYRCCCAQQ